ncbi:MAG: N-acetylmuramoyl-L-alanine amidase, partial [Fimbriimonadaceae bacterium]|nr:N-acetylmuramoyl-L-alanine amidase [Alphaproteobacteria bacterium]
MRAVGTLAYEGDLTGFCRARLFTIFAIFGKRALAAMSMMFLLAFTAASSGYANDEVRTSPANPAAFPQATDARIGGDKTRTRFVVDIDRPVSFHVFVLADPYRIIVDLPQVNFQLPDGMGTQGRGLITAYRFGLLAVGKSRIVLDADSPVLIDKSFVLPPQDGQPGRLVIDLIGTDRETFMQRLAAVQPQVPTPSPRPTPPPEMRRPSDKPVIVIDPGHGGVDSGAIASSGAQEKKLVLAFALVLQDRLKATGRYTPILTRTQDVFIALRDRVNFARNHGASLFISLHADSFRVASVRGTTVYSVSEEASDAEAAALAQKENKSDIIAGLDLRDETNEVTGILIDLAQRETKNFSVKFAEILVSSMRSTVRLNRNPHRFAGFRVLKAPDVPSVLVELGYLSNRNDVRELSSRAWRSKTSAAMV